MSVGGPSTPFQTTGGGGGSSAWTDISGKPSVFPPAPHDHDGLYYTESEIDTNLADLSQDFTNLNSDTQSNVSRLTTRQSVTHTTPSLAAGASEEFSLTMPRSFTLMSLQVSAQARVRAYGTSAARTADQARAFGADVSDAVYPALDFDGSLPHRGSLTQKTLYDFSPNTEGTWFMRLTNTGASPAAITLTLAILPREEAAAF